MVDFDADNTRIPHQNLCRKHPLIIHGNPLRSLYGMDFSNANFAVRSEENMSFILRGFHTEAASSNRTRLSPIE